MPRSRRARYRATRSRMSGVKQRRRVVHHIPNAHERQPDVLVDGGGEPDLLEIPSEGVRRPCIGPLAIGGRVLEVFRAGDRPRKIHLRGDALLQVRAQVPRLRVRELLPGASSLLRMQGSMLSFRVYFVMIAAHSGDRPGSLATRLVQSCMTSIKRWLHA